MSPSQASAMVLRRARLVDGTAPVDLVLADGRIAAVEAAGMGQGASELDLAGGLVVPGFVDAHMHLDKAFALESGLVPGDSLAGAIRGFQRWQAEVTPQSIYANARRVAEQALLHGTVALRTHTTVDLRVGLSWLEPLLRLRSELAGRLCIQIVAFPDTNEVLSGRVQPLLEEALRAGADLLGGAPAVSEEPERAVDELLAMAGAWGCDLDLHVDESDDPRVNSLEYLAERVGRLRFPGRVTAGHCCSLASMEEAQASRVIEKVAAAGLQIITLPLCNLFLMGRQDRGRVRRGLTRVKELLAAGVPVAYASDNIRDAFNPFGHADMKQVALLAALALQMGTPEELRQILTMGTTSPATLLGLPDYGLQAGCDASFAVFDDRDWASALARQAPCRYVFTHGQLVAETRVSEIV